MSIDRPKCPFMDHQQKAFVMFNFCYILHFVTFLSVKYTPTPPVGTIKNNFLTFEFLMMRICVLRKDVRVQENLLRKS